MYALPGLPGTFITLSSDADVTLMWEEWEDFQTRNSPAAATAKLQLFVDGGDASSTAAAAAAAAAADALQLHSAISIQSQPSTPSAAVANRQQQQLSEGDRHQTVSTAGTTPPAAPAGAQRTAELMSAGFAMGDHLKVLTGGFGLACRGLISGEEDFLQGFAGAQWESALQQNPNEADCLTDEDIFVTVTENLLTAASLVSGAAAAAAAVSTSGLATPAGEGDCRGGVAETATVDT